MSETDKNAVWNTAVTLIAMAEATLSETETKLKELSTFRDSLTTNLTRWKRKGRGPIAAEFCALIESSGEQDSQKR